MHDNQYIPADAGNNQDFRGTETANLKITEAEGHWYVTMTNYQHEGADTYWYANQPEGSDPNLSWWQNYGGNQALQVEFYPMTELPEAVNVTFPLNFNGETKREVVYELFPGDTYPTVNFNGLPSYVSAPAIAIEGTVPADDVTTRYVDATFDGPFAISPAPEGGTFADGTTWYALGLHNAPYYLHDTNGAENMELGAGQQAIDASTNATFDAQMWCFVGDPFDGFKLYNKAAGAGKILSSSTTMSGQNGGGTCPILVDDTALPGGNNTTWDVTPSTHISGVNGFYIAQHGLASNRMNLRDGRLAYWTGGADAGSTFRALNLGELYAANLAIMTEGYIGMPAPSAIEAQQSVIEALTSGNGTPEQYVALNTAFMSPSETVAFDPAKLYRIENLARKASTFNENHIGDGGYLEVTDKAVTEFTVDMAAIDREESRATALWQFQPTDEEGQYYLYNPNADVYVGNTTESSFVVTSATADAASHISLVALGQGQFNLQGAELTNGPLHASGPAAATAAGIQAYAGGLNSPSAWYLIPAETIDLTIGEAGYATINLPVAVQLPEGLTAYTVTSETADVITLDEVEGKVLPAGSPVLLAGAAAVYELTILPQDKTEALTTGFEGTQMAAVVPDDVNAYILAQKEGDTEAKFYQLADVAPVYASYYHLVTRANNAERAGRAIELVAEGSSIIESNNATIGQLWSAPADANSEYQRWAFEADPAGSGKYAMVCKAQPNGSVNPTPTAVSNTGRWNYDNSQKHYGFILNEGGTADGVDYYYITSSDQTTSGWFMNTAGGGQGLSINLWNDINDGSNAGYFSFNVVYDTDNVIGTDPTPRTIPANKAYYVSTLATGEALSLSFGGPAVGIDQIATPGAEKAQTYYDLQGRRVLYPSNGIYVTEDGQKVFIK